MFYYTSPANWQAKSNSSNASTSISGDYFAFDCLRTHLPDDVQLLRSSCFYSLNENCAISLQFSVRLMNDCREERERERGEFLLVLFSDSRITTTTRQRWTTAKRQNTTVERPLSESYRERKFLTCPESAEHSRKGEVFFCENN
jgi:hypothetical protein